MGCGLQNYCLAWFNTKYIKNIPLVSNPSLIFHIKWSHSMTRYSLDCIDWLNILIKKIYSVQVRCIENWSDSLSLSLETTLEVHENYRSAIERESAISMPPDSFLGPCSKSSLIRNDVLSSLVSSYAREPWPRAMPLGSGSLIPETHYASYNLVILKSRHHNERTMRGSSIETTLVYARCIKSFDYQKQFVFTKLSTGRERYMSVWKWTRH